MTAREDDPLHVDSHEFGTVRVFTTALDAEEASNITSANVQKLLGDVTLRSDKVEVVPTRALEGLGLAGYLKEGYGIPDRELEGRRAQLDSINGLVVLLPASAFGGVDQTIDPHPSMRFVGLFREEAAEPPRQMSRPETAKGTTAPSGERRSTPAPRARRGSWIVALGALIIAAALVLLIVA